MSDAEKLIAQLAGDDDREVRTYRDMEGNLAFATMDDVCIEPTEDMRVGLVQKLASHMKDEDLDSIENYEGSLNQLVNSVIHKTFNKF